MTASLLVFVPVALLALIGTFCFVGCVFHTGGLPAPPFTTYSNDDVIANPNCIAYWPLNDSSLPLFNFPKPITAVDVVGTAKGMPNNGTYKNLATDPGLFPCPAFQVGPNANSAFAPGNQTVGAPGIVQGDAVQPASDPPVLTTAMQCDGGFVEVPFSGVINPSGSFTIEAWARPEWAATDSPAVRVLIDTRNFTSTGNDGFGIYVNENGQWEAQINCTNSTNVLVTANTATLATAVHVVLTFDANNNNASLFVGGTLQSPITPMPAGQSFSPNTVLPTVFGVGAHFLNPRVNSTGNLFFPLLPFKGTIQDIAIYTAVLDDETINTHAQNGMGNATG